MEQGEKNDEKGDMERGVVELADTESLVPQGTSAGKVDKAVDFRKLYEIVEPLYEEVTPFRPAPISLTRPSRGDGGPVK